MYLECKTVHIKWKAVCLQDFREVWGKKLSENSC